VGFRDDSTFSIFYFDILVRGKLCRTHQPFGRRRGGRRASVAVPFSSTMAPHRLRRGALHLPARRSRQNVKLFPRSRGTYHSDAANATRLYVSQRFTHLSRPTLQSGLN